MQKEEADLAVAMMFYANGIPFRVVRNRYFRTMLRKVGGQGPRYKPPSYNIIRTKLLSKVKACLAAGHQGVSPMISLRIRV